MATGNSETGKKKLTVMEALIEQLKCQSEYYLEPEEAGFGPTTTMEVKDDAYWDRFVAMQDAEKDVAMADVGDGPAAKTKGGPKRKKGQPASPGEDATAMTPKTPKDTKRQKTSYRDLFLDAQNRNFIEANIGEWLTLCSPRQQQVIQQEMEDLDYGNVSGMNRSAGLIAASMREPWGRRKATVESLAAYVSSVESMPGEGGNSDLMEAWAKELEAATKTVDAWDTAIQKLEQMGGKAKD
ncbi:hypothetical protein BDY17DRAFT_355248 [Neohortaea acidophila]|uniref:Uncharacterized protein n=1 Tax=Neohortaea acidophila TaxID=245834 RepID=A0A6A6PNT4_9PEZI|nr:uncharacterized protein BDY17DRAFT_355248 [Neohortaea acidophila]KAF2481565.1 hypothetical protein BDY17DRAFT_355248 [Neohortaea acidophila]